jgi:hypothetical protein
MLALIIGHNAMNLDELAQSIRANHDLCYIVTETACKEFGWPWLSVEDAIVLLGGKRLRGLLSSSNRHGRSASQLHRTLHRNSIPPSANLCLLETFQGDSK